MVHCKYVLQPYSNTSAQSGSLGLAMKLRLISDVSVIHLKSCTERGESLAQFSRGAWIRDIKNFIFPNHKNKQVRYYFNMINKWNLT